MIILLNLFYSDTGFFKVNTLEELTKVAKEIHVKYYNKNIRRLLYIIVTFGYIHVHVKLLITFFQILQ